MIKYKLICKDCENLFRFLTNTNLNYVNKKIILTIAKWLDMKINYKCSSDIDNKKNLKAEDRLIDIIKQCGATKYLSGTGAKKYQNEDKFKLEKIKMFEYCSAKIEILSNQLCINIDKYTNVGKFFVQNIL